MAKTDLTEEIKFYKTIIHKLRTVFDVGCRDDNVFYDLNNDLEIHLFDPNDVGIEEEIKDKSNVIFNNYALGSHTGIVPFHYRYGSVIERTEEPKFDGMHQSRLVPVETIESYCKNKQITSIDFLKIDTEGYDFEVIKGCGVDLLSNIKYIQFESWTDGRFGGETDQDIFNFFKDWNIYRLNTKPVNYVVTKELLPLDKKDIVQRR